MVDPPFEYSEFDEGRHVNYWTLNPALQDEARRLYPEDEFEWAAANLAAFGGLVGEPIADNADRIDTHSPELRTHDKHGQLLNEVQYHPDQHENERLIYEHGIVADAFTAPPGRDDPVGLLHTLTEQLLLSYADTGLVCAQSMTAGAALVLRNHDHAGTYSQYLDALTTRDYDSAIEGAMFMTEEQGGSDVGATETVAEPAAQSPPGPKAMPRVQQFGRHRTAGTSNSERTNSPARNGSVRTSTPRRRSRSLGDLTPPTERTACRYFSFHTSSPPAG
ncbi:isovaleryl CoA dehydrogenase [Halolamina pelagica]|uniref:Isovaleryl CoA dehydrogenase n=1 Tax=Halolamina pelagica TaxID=699431 RepID=A0A0P7GKU7_9EURY|nr:isovaleryl CoA dehydrogenase [Halolamina pelagica]